MLQTFSHITELGYQTMQAIPPGTLIRVSWIDIPDANAEWGLNSIDFDDDAEDNIVMLVKWRPEVKNVQNVISFQCLWQDQLANSASSCIREIVK